MGITLYPFVFLKSKNLKSNSVFINHEKIHLRQQLELLIIPFYLFYVFEFLVRFIQYKTWLKAYKNISFERESSRNETRMDYLKYRPFWAFLKYLRADGNWASK